MKIKLYLWTIMFAMVGLLLLAACEKEGPAEKAGEKIDEAIEETKEEAEQAKENVEDAVKE